MDFKNTFWLNRDSIFMSCESHENAIYQKHLFSLSKCIEISLFYDFRYVFHLDDLKTPIHFPRFENLAFSREASLNLLPSPSLIYSD